MTTRRTAQGFTLVEMMVGMSLALIVMGGVLSSYIFIGRNLVRLANQQSLEEQSRRLQLYFAQDVRMSSSIHYTTDGVTSDTTDPGPTSTNVTFHMPTSTGATTWVTYTYDNSAGTLTRTPAGGTGQVILRNVVSGSFAITYYSATSTVTATDSVSLSSIRGVSLAYSAQLGTNFNGTQTRVYQYNTPKVIMYNKSWSP